MTHGRHGRRRRRAPAGWAALSVALLAAAGLLGTAAARQSSDGPTGTAPPPALLQPLELRPTPAAAAPAASALAAEATTVADGPAPAAPPPAVRPTSLRIPALELAVPLSGLGLQDDGTVEVPADPDDAGWFDLGPPPGQPGSAVVLGHVDSRRGPGVFFGLHTLEAGDVVDVGLEDGTTARFAVTSVETYAKDAFPGELVYGGTGASTLNLVTCGGDFDRDARSYLSNVVVSTALIG